MLKVFNVFRFTKAQGKVIKKTPAIGLVTVLVMLAIPLLAYFTLRSPAVQTYLAGKAAQYLSDELGAKVSVGGVNITLFLNIVLEDVSMLDQSDSDMIYSKQMIFNISRLSFSKKYIYFNKISLEDATIKVSRMVGEEDFNYQFLVNYFSKNKSDTTALRPWEVLIRSFAFTNASIQLTDHNAEHLENGFDINNFSLTDLTIEVKDIDLEDDFLTAELVNLSLTESKGFQIHALSAEIDMSPESSRIYNLQLTTHGSQLGMNIVMNYDGLKAFRNFAEDVSFEIDIQPSQLTLYEISYFVPEMYGLDGKMTFNGILAGRFNNLRGKDISLQYGARTSFKGNFNFVGLPVIEETFINFSVEKLITWAPDIESIKLPNSSTSSHIMIPDDLKRFGITSFNGNFTGFLNDFVAFGNFSTALGNINTSIAIISSPDYKDVTYTGNVSTTGFNLNGLLEDENFGNISLSTHVKGKGYNLNNLDLSLTGQIQLLEFRDYEYKNLQIAGTFDKKMFNGSFLVNDPNLKLDFSGMINFRDNTPQMKFTAQIDDANLTRLNIYQRDSLFDSYISTLIKVDGRGSSYAKLEGEINAYSSSYHERSGIDAGDSVFYNHIQTDVIALEHKIISPILHEMRLYSDFLDIRLDGELHYDQFGSSVSRFFYNYAPSLYKKPPPVSTNNGSQQNADFSIHIKNTTELTDIFYPTLQIAAHSYFNGHLDSYKNEFTLKGGAKYLKLGASLLRNPEINMISDSSHLEIIAKGQQLFFTDSIFMENFFTSGILAKDTITLLTQWENYSTKMKNQGSLKTMGVILSPTRSEFLLLPSYAYINDSLWSISPDNSIIIDTNSVAVNNFHLYKKNEYLMVNGVLSENPQDELDIILNNFNLKSIAFLLEDRKIDFSGIASGELKLSTIKTSPNIVSHLLIKNFAFNKDHLGDLTLSSRWDAAQKAFKVDTEIIYYGNVGSNIPLVASGYFYPERENNNFDIDITIENLKMSIFGRYIEDFASNFRGLASGKLRLEGPLNAPELSGKARLVRTGFRVDYLNTTYSFAHEVEVAKNHFKIDNLVLNDTLGNSANVSGIIRHRNFHNFEIDFTLQPERMIVLNTRPHHNELFYGTAFASGLAHIHGKVTDIKIDVVATSNRGTQIFLPLDSNGELTESSFISFVSTHTDKTNGINFQMPQDLGISLNFDLSLTPDAEVQIIFDSKIGDIMRGRGFGDLKMELDKQGFFFMYGDYSIQEGDYLFTLQNLINKRFRMMQGGNIRWTGDPYDADIDIKAIYRLRTSLFDLAANQTDTSDIYRRRVPVETVLHLQNKLFNPSINFQIQLPGSDESTRDMIDRIISTDQEMNRQVFSLLILNRFVPPEDGFNSALSYGMGSTSTELLSNQLSNWLSQISNDFDIGVNYRPGDEISSQEVELALSTQLFNDRVVIDGNFGVAGNHPAQTQRTSNIIGDVNVEVKITPEGKFRVKAFNRSNTFDLLNTNGPYTQGVGVFYRREFDNLSDLFRRNKKTTEEIQEIEDLETSLP